MEPIEIIVIIVCSLIVLGVVIMALINKKKGKTSCGCDCANCKGCTHKNSYKTDKVQK